MGRDYPGESHKHPAASYQSTCPADFEPRCKNPTSSALLPASRGPSSSETSLNPSGASRRKLKHALLTSALLDSPIPDIHTQVRPLVELKIRFCDSLVDCSRLSDVHRIEG
ncbi:hypothetical protein PAXRUDRAFT_658892 [Paxillus rubicundulus Ve08.2h10]|uniref:Uncharacterized protein n=1 Tax=Paxillus rubicundulus Ve08.2h10 TaxID=930991 RepID=A0A0D0E291_9AGAM|nr:hypothetical protein PAXRUDRAFT_658892 [Paxillus rubicundulus Ve08.2h10]